ncbi:hypothetical protein MTR67_035452 [Solanum verrucosum]|uniref:CCHC-type domain-containing protein n=1 Tax=Solanum verrucosum TaxID=315347 RepID=A0AAF0U9Y9_SOLVR|nr:hypothetical protein MTR67_035452 [Solanum verrucosum]
MKTQANREDMVLMNPNVGTAITREKFKERSRDAKIAKTSDADFSHSRSDGHDRSKFRQRCRRKHEGKCLAGMDGCFGCGKSGHKIRDCASLIPKERGGMDWLHSCYASIECRSRVVKFQFLNELVLSGKRGNYMPKDTQPIFIPPYHMASIKLKELKEKLENLLDKGFIRPSALHGACGASPQGPITICKVWQMRVLVKIHGFIGHIISGKGIEVDPKKTYTVKRSLA